MKSFLAIAWTFILIMDIIHCINGVSPSWHDAFAPLIVVVCESWLDWGIEYFNKHKNK